MGEGHAGSAGDGGLVGGKGLTQQDPNRPSREPFPAKHEREVKTGSELGCNQVGFTFVT